MADHKHPTYSYVPKRSEHQGAPRLPHERRGGRRGPAAGGRAHAHTNELEVQMPDEPECCVTSWRSEPQYPCLQPPRMPPHVLVTPRDMEQWRQHMAWHVKHDPPGPHWACEDHAPAERDPSINWIGGHRPQLPRDLDQFELPLDEGEQPWGIPPPVEMCQLEDPDHPDEQDVGLQTDDPVSNHDLAGVLPGDRFDHGNRALPASGLFMPAYVGGAGATAKDLVGDRAHYKHAVDSRFNEIPQCSHMHIGNRASKQYSANWWCSNAADAAACAGMDATWADYCWSMALACAAFLAFMLVSREYWLCVGMWGPIWPSAVYRLFDLRWAIIWAIVTIGLAIGSVRMYLRSHYTGDYVPVVAIARISAEHHVDEGLMAIAIHTVNFRPRTTSSARGLLNVLTEWCKANRPAWGPLDIEQQISMVMPLALRMRTPAEYLYARIGGRFAPE
jgi:hypothetical protein